MKIEALDSTGEFFSLIITEHKGERLEWNANDYERGNDRSSDMVFNHINKFFESLPMEKQDKIWECYVEIKEMIDVIYDANRLHTFLTESVAKLYKLLPLEDFNHWINIKSDIYIPLDIKKDYDIDDNLERTYVRADYANLILLSLSLRPIVPIWSEYNTKVKSLSGNTYKEHQSLRLLGKTEIIHHPAMEKLRDYVESNAAAMVEIGSDGHSTAAIINGLGTTELPGWLLALAIVRRVAIADLDGGSEKGSIIANVYKYINNTIKGLDKRFKGKIKKKEQQSGDDEDNASVIEGYKVKQEQSDGDLVTLSIFTEHQADIIKRIEPDLDPFKLNACLKSIGSILELDIHPHQITLTQWVISPIIPGRGVPYLNKQALLNIMAICQAVLWHRGFNDLAKLITARPLLSDDEETMLGGYEQRSLIPKELMDELIRLYPYYPKLQNKQQGDRKSNPASKAIDILAKDLVREEWILLAPVELSEGETRMLTPPDIKAQLAKFIIDRLKRNTNESS